MVLSLHCCCRTVASLIESCHHLLFKDVKSNFINSVLNETADAGPNAIPSIALNRIRASECYDRHGSCRAQLQLVI